MSVQSVGLEKRGSFGGFQAYNSLSAVEGQGFIAYASVADLSPQLLNSTARLWILNLIITVGTLPLGASVTGWGVGMIVPISDSVSHYASNTCAFNDDAASSLTTGSVIAVPLTWLQTANAPSNISIGSCLAVLGATVPYTVQVNGYFVDF